MFILTRTCKQCGETKPIESYRPYYLVSASADANKHISRYRLCLDCEKVNSRYKYLNKILNDVTMFINSDRRAELQSELSAIEELYDAQRSVGLAPPTPKPKPKPSNIDTTAPESPANNIESFVDSIRRQTASYKLQAFSLRNLLPSDQYNDQFSNPSASLPLAAVPQELMQWLTRTPTSIKSLNQSPDDLYVIYDALDTKYRPILSVDHTGLQIRDNTYKPLLERIYKLFCEYEDIYYSDEDPAN